MSKHARKLPSGSWNIQVIESRHWDDKREKWIYHRKSITAPTKSQAELLAAEWEESHNPKGINKYSIREFPLEEVDETTFSKDDLKQFLKENFRTINGQKFEAICSAILKHMGYLCKQTVYTGDHGADIIATRGNISFAVQCKYSSHTIGFDAVKEAFTAKGIYGTNQSIVMTNSTFTAQAILDASSLGVSLWGGEELAKLIGTIIKGRDV